MPEARPLIACEIAPDRVLAGRVSLSGQMLEVYAARELAPGSVVPDLTESNIRQPEALRNALREVLDEVSGKSKDVIAILPDAAARVMLLDFDTLPTNPKESDGVVRFRLKKSLPFEVDQAKVSYVSQPAKESGVRVVAAVVMSKVLEEYEAAFRDAGYSPGIVVPSMIAAMGAAEAARPTLIVKVDARSTSIAIMDQQQLLLFRTLENMRGVTITGEQLAEDVYPSVVFFQDTYHLNLEHIYVSGLPDTGGAGPALRAQTGAEVHELVEPAQLGAGGSGSAPRWRMAGVVGALVSTTRLDVSLATQPYEDGHRFWVRWGAVLGTAAVLTLALLITTISSWMTASKDRAQISNLKDQIAKCDQDRTRAQEVLGRPENRATRDQSQFINGLIRRKAFSWTQVFADLEHMMPPELRVTSIHPEMAKDSNQLQIKLNVAGKSRDRALQLIHRMEQSPRFLDPHVESEQGQQSQPNGDVVNFEIASAYIPDKDLPAGTDAKSGSTNSTGPKTGAPKTGGPKTGSKPGAKSGPLKPAAIKARVNPAANTATKPFTPADRRPH